MEVAPANAALVSIEDAVSGGRSGDTQVMSNFLCVLVELHSSHVEVEVVADDRLLEICVELDRPLVLANESVCPAQLETLAV